MEAPAARHLLRAASAETAEHAGTRILKILVMVNTKTKFPRGILDQVISLRAHDGECERASWSGPQAASFKPQASSFRTNLVKHQATSHKPGGTSLKLQAASHKLPDPRSMEHGYRRSFRG